MTSKYNTTQLHPEITFEKHVYHRDQFAHYFRWCYVMNQIHGMDRPTILDFGCGNGNLAEVLYRNRRHCEMYYGLDVRKQTIDKLREKWKQIPWAHWNDADLVKPFETSIASIKGSWDYITCFEVIEHIGKKNAPQFLDNIAMCMDEESTLLLSTPNYDEKVGAANNHIINGEICEFTHQELQVLLSERFTIVKKFGTFASVKDYKPLLNEWQKQMYDGLKEFYDQDLVSNIMAPFFPEQSRNTLWVCKLKEVQ